MRTLLFLALATMPMAAIAEDDADPTPTETYRAEYAAYAKQAEHTLSRSNDGLALVLASQLLLSRERVPPDEATGLPLDSTLQRDQLIHRARRLAGDDALVWWSLAYDCPASAAACDRTAALARLREIDPDNALVWLVDLPGGTPDDAAALDATLEQAARATRFDMHYVERAARYAELLGPIEPSASLLAAIPTEFLVPATADGVQMMVALGFVLGQSVPAITPITNTCKAAAAHPGSARHTSCRAIAGTLASTSDSLLGARIGSNLQLALAAPGAERDAAGATQRKLAWLWEAGAELQSSGADDPVFTAEQLARWRTPGATELSMLRDLLRDQGVPLDPPTDWTPVSTAWQATPTAAAAN